MAAWRDDIISAFNELGGEASYDELYPVLERIRIAGSGGLTRQWKATVRRTIEDHSPDSSNYRVSTPVFYSVNGLGSGRWALFPDFMNSKDGDNLSDYLRNGELYAQGFEGIEREHRYLKRSRDPRLVEERKKIDKFTCKCCGFVKNVSGVYIIDVHHLNPLASSGPAITSLDQLICLCPNCHRIAHTRKERPLTVKEIIEILKVNKS